MSHSAGGGGQHIQVAKVVVAIAGIEEDFLDFSHLSGGSEGIPWIQMTCDLDQREFLGLYSPGCTIRTLDNFHIAIYSLPT